MKKKLLIVFAMLFCISLCFLLTSCDNLSEYIDSELKSVDGSMNMIYVQSDDKTYYRLVGMGTYDKTEVVIPDKHNGLPVKEIAKGALSTANNPQASYIKSIIIPKSVEVIGDGAFSGCAELTSVMIPESITSIGKSAFSGCSSLTSVAIPNSVAYIGAAAFSGCSNLTIYTKLSSKPSEWAHNWNNSYCPVIWSYYAYTGGVIYGLHTDNTVYVIGYVLNDTEIVIPESIDGHSVAFIGDGAFSGCTSLTSVTIPNSIISIEKDAFSDCSSLTSITIPNSVVFIDDDAFSGCTSLTQVTLPNNVTHIGNSAFASCYSLTSVIIPNSVTSIGHSAFKNCFRLTSIAIPNSVTSIDFSTFSGCSSLTSVVIPNSVTSIGSYAFLYCFKLNSITIPDSVMYIGHDAFGGCRNLSIYAEAESQPEGWDSDWSYGCICTTEWGYKK